MNPGKQDITIFIITPIPWFVNHIPLFVCFCIFLFNQAGSKVLITTYRTMIDTNEQKCYD